MHKFTVLFAVLTWAAEEEPLVEGSGIGTHLMRLITGSPNAAVTRAEGKAAEEPRPQTPALRAASYSSVVESEGPSASSQFAAVFEKAVPIAAQSPVMECVPLDHYEALWHENRMLEQEIVELVAQLQARPVSSDDLISTMMVDLFAPAPPSFRRAFLSH